MLLIIIALRGTGIEYRLHAMILLHTFHVLHAMIFFFLHGTTPRFYSRNSSADDQRWLPGYSLHNKNKRTGTYK